MLSVLGFLFSDSEGAAESSFSGLSPFIAFAFVIGIMAFMPRIIRKIRRERRALEQQETKELLNRPHIKNNADEILVELAEMSREINAQVDTKIRVLNKLIRDADRLVKRYEELTAEKQNLQRPVHAESGSSPVKDEVGITDKAEIKLAGLEEAVADNTFKEKVESETDAGASEITTSETGVWQRSVGAKIQELHDKGYNVSDIARKTRMSIAEVTLMLEMFKKNN